MVSVMLYHCIVWVALLMELFVYYLFKSLRAGSHVFALRMLFLCMVWHTMWSGKSL